MRAIGWLVLGACLSVCCSHEPQPAQEADARRLWGGLAVAVSGGHYGWALDYESPETAAEAAQTKCGPGCSLVLTFDKCAAYVSEQDRNVVRNWEESDVSAQDAAWAAREKCAIYGGLMCTVRVSGCNGPVIEAALGLERRHRREVQRGLFVEGFSPGAADGVFGPLTRAAIRKWQTRSGVRETGYLDAEASNELRAAGKGCSGRLHAWHLLDMIPCIRLQRGTDRE